MLLLQINEAEPNRPDATQTWEIMMKERGLWKSDDGWGGQRSKNTSTGCHGCVCVCVRVCVCARARAHACVCIDQSRDKNHHVDENFALIHYLSLLLELSLGEEYIVGPSPPSAPPV